VVWFLDVNTGYLFAYPEGGEHGASALTFLAFAAGAVVLWRRGRRIPVALCLLPFGLALAAYAHFTSPIRRYADLLVHRALIRGLKLGPGGLEADEAARLPDTAEHITATERRAALAERDAIDRYLAAFMADKVGSVFEARISGVTRFGLFVTVSGSGASGLVPVSSLPDDFWFHDEATQTLSGRRTRLTFRLAQQVEARLAEASLLTGGLVFHILQGAPQRRSALPAPALGVRSGRQGSGRRARPR